MKAPRVRSRSRSSPESALQRDVVRYLAAAQPRCIWFHVPNGGSRDIREASIFKGLGVRAGVADLVFLGSGGAACIELKAGKGKQSPAQLQFEEDCARLGIPYEVCTSFEEVHACMVRWGFVDGARVVVR